MSEQIKVNTGLLKYDVVDQDGKKLGEFSFNPFDTGLAKRFIEVVKNIVNMKRNVVIDDSLSTFVNLQKEVEKQMEYLIGNDSVNVFFDVMGAFSILPSGELYIEHILSIIEKLIKEENDKRMKVVKNRINKYAAKHGK